MPERKPGDTHAISDTGPLISAFQCDGLPIITQLLPVIHIPQACYGELVGHGWEIALQNAGEIVQVHALTSDERQVTVEVAQRIAALSPKNLDPTHHLGEAEAIVLAKRAEFVHDVLLLDELAARAIAQEEGLQLTGFAGVLLLATWQGILSADELKQRLETCQQQGTRYSKAFIEQIYLTAQVCEEKKS